jgi:parallel beta-helix repeat protein
MILLAALPFLAAAGRLFATTYYVDFESGLDSRTGTSPAQSWQHCPGDAAATGIAKSTTNRPGDIVIFKGGVEYPGGLSLTSSGAEGNPITFDGNTAGTFGSGAAIFSGALPVTNWGRCTSQADAGGAPDWVNCFVTGLSTNTGLTEPWMANLFYDDNVRGVVARKPDAAEPLWWDNLNEYQPVANADVTTNTLNLPVAFAAHPGEDWAGAYAGTWAGDNRIKFRGIISVSGDGLTITLKTNDAPRSSGNRFALFNHPRLLSARGEFVLTADKSRIIFYAGSGGTAPSNVVVSARRYGINLNGISHYVFKGITFTRFAGSTTDTRGGAGVISWTGGARPADIVIQNCTFSQNLAMVSRTSPVSMGIVDRLTVDRCRVFENQGGRGIHAGGCKDVVISNNELDRNGGTGIFNQATENSLIISNRVTGHLGMHANGISVYQGSTNVTVQNNLVKGGLIALTIQSSRDVTLSYNVLATSVFEGNVLSVWDPLGGYPSSINVTIRNNTVFCNGGGQAKGFGNSDPGALSSLRIYNNTLHGGLTNTIAEMHNNFYTGLSWTQQTKYGWELEPGSIVATNGEVIFINPAQDDYRIKAGSRVMDTATDWGQAGDFSGTVKTGSAWDIGAYEYTPVSDSDSDGIPDDWETQYFGGVTNANPNALAANGVNTIYETYIAGLNPTNPASVFLISDFRPLTSASTLQWQSASGRVYSVYWTTNLLSGFQPLETNIVWPQSNWTDMVHGAQDDGFYKIKVQLGQ